MKNNSRLSGNAFRPCIAVRRPALTVAAAMVVAAFGSAAIAEPMLQHRNVSRLADMSRWTDNYVELGVGYNSKDSYKFGEWNGLREDGAYPIVGFNWLSRSQDNDAAYWQVHGSGLGLETRMLSGELGVQGRWKLTAGADRLVRSELDTGKYIHRGLGGNRLTLAPGCSGFASIAAINTACLQPYKVEQGRDFYRLGYNVALSGGWDFAVNYREDVRDGTRVMGFITNAGQSLPVPYGIDDQTQQIEAQLSYADRNSQVQLGYYYSRYENDFSALDLVNPIRTSTNPPTNSTFRNDEPNRMSLAPSNDFHQLQLTAAHSLTRDTRVTGKLSYGVGTQNDAFLDYSVNSSALLTGQGVPAPLRPTDRKSLEGEIVRTLVDLGVNTRPSKDSTLKIGYQYQEYDNRTPKSEYLYWGRDTFATPTAASAMTRTNAPVSSTEHKGVVDGDYYLSANTVLRGQVEYRQVQYELVDRAETETTKAGLELRRPVFDTVMGSVGYWYTEKTGSDYDKNVFFRNSYTNPTFQTSVTTSGGILTNHPSMRTFIYADYDEDRFRTSANWAVTETVSLQSSLDGYRQRFKGPDCARIMDPVVNAALPDLPDTCLGRTLAEGGSLNLDLQWQPEENISLFSFMNLAETVIEQRGRTWAPNTTTNTNNIGSVADLRRDWFGRSTNQDHSVGIGGKWLPKETLDLGAQYVFGHSVSKAAIVQAAVLAVPGSTAVNAGAFPNSTALPDAETTTHTVQLYAKWNYSRKLTFRLNYLYETLESSNWAYDGIGMTANSSVLMTGQASPKYENHVIGVSVALSSW